ncbi:hypothetical protein [Variovorax boronicumulans]|uniref:hypothetical protein n=1 Tax=Variovorax boronicumulans TaxID=436515 RepID=UPI001C586077
MTSTEKISLAWLNGPASKFGALNISNDAIELINKSESLKSSIRAYAESEAAGKVRALAKDGAASYHIPFGDARGFLEFSIDLLSAPEKLSMSWPMSLGISRSKDRTRRFLGQGLTRWRKK